MFLIVLSAQVAGNRTLKQNGPVHRGHARHTLHVDLVLVGALDRRNRENAIRLIAEHRTTRGARTGT
jgi:hypothetical protein